MKKTDEQLLDEVIFFLKTHDISDEIKTIINDLFIRADRERPFYE